MSIGERLKSLRVDKGLTQKQLADQLGLSLDMIKSLEQNRTSLSVETLTKLVEFFDCSADYVMCRTDEPHGRVPVTLDELLQFKPFFNKMFHEYKDQLGKEETDNFRKLMDLFDEFEASKKDPH